MVAGRRNEELENLGKRNLHSFDLTELLEQSLIILWSQWSLAYDLPHAPEALLQLRQVSTRHALLEGKASFLPLCCDGTSKITMKSRMGLVISADT